MLMMASFLFVCFASALFLVLLERLNIVGLSLDVVADSRSAIAIIADADLDDDDKEIAIQRMSGRMLLNFAKIAGLTLVALAVPGGLIAAVVGLGWSDSDTLEGIVLSVPFIALNVVAFAAVCYWRYRK